MATADDREGRVHDSLTGVLSRAAFVPNLRQILARSARRSAPVGMLVLNVDNTAMINDAWGRDFGDAVLVEIAACLVEECRDGDVVARLGGDEFAVVLDDTPTLAVIGVAERLGDVLRRGVTAQGRHLPIHASIGAAMTWGTEGPDALVRNAEIAMRAAKRAGKDDIELFDADVHGHSLARVALAASLDEAIASGQITLRYQPIVDLVTGEALGLEALARWEHPVHGELPAGDFIGIAEETGLIVPLGRQVVAEACAQVHRWTRQYTGRPPLLINVNLSPRQLVSRRIVDDVAAALTSSGLDPIQLVVEITESSAMQGPATAAANIQAIRAMGARVAIDDFGTGYSNLDRLAEQPVDILKIDRSFIAPIGEGVEPVLADTIITLGKRLGLFVLAEGIETTRQADKLLELGCVFGQGFLYSRPVHAAGIEALLADAGASKPTAAFVPDRSAT